MNPNKKHNPKHSNQVRIIGGDLRGRKIPFISADGLRPTPDSVRERLFNWLGQDLTAQHTLDLFAGSGVLSFEAISRHAQSATLCDTNPQTIRQLHSIAQQLNIANPIHIHQQNAIAYLHATYQQYHTIFLDPPYAWHDWANLFPALQSHLQPHAYIYLEASQIPPLPEWLPIHRQGKAGQSQFLLLQYTQPTD